MLRHSVSHVGLNFQMCFCEFNLKLLNLKLRHNKVFYFFTVANILGCIGGVGTIFTNDFWDFAICRFLVGMSVDSCFLMLYIIG